MTPQEARAEFRAIAYEIGDKASISLEIVVWRDSYAVGCWPFGLSGNNPYIREEADNLPALAAKLRAAWAKIRDAAAAEQIRKLSLAIIRLTYDQGECTDAAIRANGFTDQDLERYGDAAVERANEMAGLGPFSIRKLVGANGMPDEEAA